MLGTQTGKPRDESLSEILGIRQSRNLFAGPKIVVNARQTFLETSSNSEGGNKLTGARRESRAIR